MSDDWSREVEIKKVDEAQNLVFGWLSVITKADGSPVVDSQDDIIPVEELETAAYEFMVASRRGDIMHDGVAKAVAVESFVSTPEKRAAMGLGDPADQTVGWWVGLKVDPTEFAKVKARELRSFSIGGQAIRQKAA